MTEPAPIYVLPRKAGEVLEARKRIEGTVSPEIVIALCGPIGTPLHLVAETLSRLLRQEYQYDVAEILRLSSYIRATIESSSPTLNELIAAGNELRREHGAAVLAQLAIRKILRDRLAKQTPYLVDRQMELLDGHDVPADAIAPTPVVRHCHIIDSIKNKEELSLLRSVYGDMLHVIGVYAPLDQRVQAIEHDFQLTQGEVYGLIDTDSGEEFEHGQSVRDVFPQSDFFLRAGDGSDAQVASALKRYLDLLLRVRIVTPKASERAMYAAYSAARNSACLSRQVGAALTDEAGDLLATGWNDVPAPFGGLYQTTEEGVQARPDQRCWNRGGGKCFNDEEKDGIAKLIADALVDGGVIRREQASRASETIRHHTQLKDLIEFSRAVHAEMHALLNGGQAAGSRIRGGKLYVTTYPCHSCARHIVAAGVREIYFIEPYRKSRAMRLHADAITESESDDTKVRIVPFDGVAPSRYLRLFSEPSEGRKDRGSGRMLPHAVVPMTATTLEAVQTLESIATRELESKNKLSKLS
jgi:deoxycytidylate deaminase